ncbi:hypothetical protein CGCSCA1_v012037 [Colletotrichum siamense]|nr:hypothetical protein CGCSCA1_v012037 [Colletotrichum siamense]
MAKPHRLLSTGNCELFDQNLDDRPTGITSDLPLQIRVESGQGAFETRLAAYTRFGSSLATPLLARSLNLRRFPLLPRPHSPRPYMYQTPFGPLDFKSFVHLSVQAPEAGIPCTSVNVLVLEDDHQWHNVDLFLGQNFRAKAMNVIASPNISSFQSLKDEQQVPGASHVAVTSQMRTPAIAPKPFSTTPEASMDLMGINNQRSSRPYQSALEAHCILDDHQMSPSVTPPTSLIEAQHNKGLISELLKETPSRMMPMGVPRISTEAEEPELSSGLEDTLAQLTGRSEPLMCLISEIRHSSPAKMIMSTSCKTSWTDHVKLALEELTKHRWTWWPFTPPKQPLKDNECHLEWTCVGGSSDDIQTSGF